MNANQETLKNRESRARHMVGRLGCRLMKNRSFGGYQIVDHRNFLVAGWTDGGRGFGFDLDDVENWIEAEGVL